MYKTFMNRIFTHIDMERFLAFIKWKIHDSVKQNI